ncbi:MAG: energy transducer TonB [Xanthomonadales bacterium]|nr:energy transducer TonB [Xanthomonadales bacterium]
MSVAQDNASPSFRLLRDGFRHAALSVALVLAITACGGDKADPETAAQPAPAATTATQAPAQVVSAQVAAMSVDQLREAARAAQLEQRMYAPAGNNAMEYYLALRDKQPNDAAVASALTDLMPYALIATEQSIARDDFPEAQRLFALMEKTDKAAPALPRLKQSLTDAQTSFAQRQQQTEVDAETEKARLAKLEEDRRKEQEEAQRKAAERLAQQATQQEAAQQLAAQQAAAQREAEQRLAAEREAAQREAAQREAAQRAAQAQPATATASDLRAISTPSPKYPLEAQRAGISGEVLVEFTVATDGSVSAARVVRGNPPRTFDREALSAVKRWRFQPVASPVTTRRTIGFKPGA